MFAWYESASFELQVVKKCVVDACSRRAMSWIVVSYGCERVLLTSESERQSRVAHVNDGTAKKPETAGHELELGLLTWTEAMATFTHPYPPSCLA